MTALADMGSTRKVDHVLAASKELRTGHRQPAGGRGWYGAVLGAVEVSRITPPGAQVVTGGAAELVPEDLPSGR